MDSEKYVYIVKGKIKLLKYYTLAVLIPAVLVITFNIIYNLALYIKERDYKSEWLTAEPVFYYSILLILFNSAFICVLSLPVFLNKYIRVRNNAVWSFLSWFLLPMTWIGYLLSTHIHYVIKYKQTIGDDSIFVISNTIPFIIGLVLTFILFRRNLKKHVD
jgi:hypothetical protein